MCKCQSPSLQGQIEGEEGLHVRPRYLSLVILGKMMLVVDLGMTHINMGVASVPGSAVHLVLCMLRRARQVLAKPVVHSSPAQQSNNACHGKSEEQKLGVVSQGRLPGGERGWVWG